MQKKRSPRARGETRTNFVYVRRFDNASLVLACYDPKTLYRREIFEVRAKRVAPTRSNLVSTVFSLAKTRSVRELARENGVRAKVHVRGATSLVQGEVIFSRHVQKNALSQHLADDCYCLRVPARIKLSRYRYICVSFERSGNTFSRESALRRKKKRDLLSAVQTTAFAHSALERGIRAGRADCSRSFPPFTSYKEELAIRTKIDKRQWTFYSMVIIYFQINFTPLVEVAKGKIASLIF